LSRNPPPAAEFPAKPAGEGTLTLFLGADREMALIAQVLDDGGLAGCFHVAFEKLSGLGDRLVSIYGHRFSTFPW
jgi:hypothetical protein